MPRDRGQMLLFPGPTFLRRQCPHHFTEKDPAAQESAKFAKITEPGLVSHPF